MSLVLTQGANQHAQVNARALRLMLAHLADAGVVLGGRRAGRRNCVGAGQWALQSEEGGGPGMWPRLRPQATEMHGMAGTFPRARAQMCPQPGEAPHCTKAALDSVQAHQPHCFSRVWDLS